MKKVKNQIKVAILSLLIFSIGLVLVTSCEEDDSKVDGMVGTYTFSSAVLTEDAMYNAEVLLPSGTDVSLIVGGGMFGNTPCDNILKSAIELRKSKEIYFVCIGELNEQKAGTWSINDGRTLLTLNLSAPPMAAPLSLELTDLVEGATNFSGSLTGLPVPSELFQLPAGGVVMLAITIQFNKLAI